MNHDRRPTFRCARLAAAALALGMFSTVGIAGVGAQEASPEAVACVSPGLAAAHDMAAMDMGTPEAAEADAATAEEADDATAAGIFAEVENYFACYNEGQASGDPGLYVALESSAFIESEGSADAEERVASEIDSVFPSVTLLDVDNAQIWSDGRVSADVQAMVGPHWYNEWTWFMVEEDGIWKLDERVDLPPRPDVDFVAVNGINITETTDEASGEVTYAFESRSGSWDFTATDAIVLNFTNSGVEPHEAILLQLPEGVDPLGLLDGSVDMSQVTFLGGVFDIEPGTTADLTMIDLPEGTYTLICFIPGPDGSPHAVHGMVQQFNVVAPAEG